MKWQALLLSALVLFLMPVPLRAQTPASPSVHAHPASPSQVAPPSSLLQPALTNLQQTLASLNFEKWHRGSIREEASSNVGSLLKDIQENVPLLLKQIDASPSSIPVALPVSAHMNALYEVLLRVEEASRVSGPAEQATALQDSLTDLSKARRAYEDRMQQTATVQEKEVNSLRSRLNREIATRPQSIPVPMVLPCGAFTVRRHHVVRKKPATAPAQNKTAPAAPAQPQKK